MQTTIWPIKTQKQKSVHKAWVTANKYVANQTQLTPTFKKRMKTDKCQCTQHKGQNKHPLLDRTNENNSGASWKLILYKRSSDDKYPKNIDLVGIRI